MVIFHSKMLVHQRVTEKKKHSNLLVAFFPKIRGFIETNFRVTPSADMSEVRGHAKR